MVPQTAISWFPPLLFMMWVLSVSAPDADLVQLDCHVSGGYVDISFFRPSETYNNVAKKKYGDINFQKTGLLMRFPPEYYVVDWSDVESISFQREEKGAQEGTLAVHFRELFGFLVVPHKIGHIEAKCWNEVRIFIMASGIAGKLTELYAPKDSVNDDNL